MKTVYAALAASAIAGLLATVFFTHQLAARAGAATTAADQRKEPMLAHIVFFKLKESNAANRQKLVDACHKYLADHAGVEFYAAGVVSDLDRPVNDRDFDVALHVVFKDRAAHDAYQVAETHQKFIAENKDSWAKVRVFDSDVSGAK